MKIRNAAPADDDRDLEPPADRAAEPDGAIVPAAADADPGAAERTADRVDLSGLSVAGIKRRHVGWVAAGLLSIWIVIVFARQVSDAGAASNRVADLAAANVALSAEVASLQNEANLIVRPAYVAIQAHAYGLGSPREIPFTLAPSVGAPAAGAPGSASVRLGAHVDRQTPLESWLSMLFGPGS